MSSHLILPFANEIFRRNKTRIQAILMLGDVKILICKNLFDLIMAQINFLLSNNIKNNLETRLIQGQIWDIYYYIEFFYSKIHKNGVKRINTICELYIKYQDGNFIIINLVINNIYYQYDIDSYNKLIKCIRD